ARAPWRESVPYRRVVRKLRFRRAREWSIRDRAVQPYKPDRRASRGVVRPMAQAEKAGDRSVSERRHFPYRDRTVRPVVRPSSLGHFTSVGSSINRLLKEPVAAPGQKSHWLCWNFAA